MTESGKRKLHSLLFDGDKELINLKLFPGTEAGLPADVLAGAAADALSRAMTARESGVPSRAPSTGLDKRPLMG